MPQIVNIGGSDTATPINVKKRVDVVAKWVDMGRARILDAGCGAGEYVEALSKLGARVEGIEFVAEKVEQWNSKHVNDNRVQKGNLEQLDLEDCLFDAVLLNEVLEHVPDDARALSELYRVLRPGGTLIVFSPNRFHPFETHGVYSLKTGAHHGVARTLFLPWIPVSLGSRYLDYWARNYWPAELALLISAAGSEIKHHGFVWQTFENNSGQGPRWLRKVAPVARRISSFLERLPLVRCLGVSQLIVAVRI